MAHTKCLVVEFLSRRNKSCWCFGNEMGGYSRWKTTIPNEQKQKSSFFKNPRQGFDDSFLLWTLQSLERRIFPELKGVDVKDSKAVLSAIRNANKTLNKYLKRLAKLANINKNITMHISRHTFGNISGDKISIQMLQKLYRHSSITTTVNYQANFISKDIDDALDAVIDF